MKLREILMAEATPAEQPGSTGSPSTPPTTPSEAPAATPAPSEPAELVAEEEIAEGEAEPSVNWDELLTDEDEEAAEPAAAATETPASPTPPPAEPSPQPAAAQPATPPAVQPETPKPAEQPPAQPAKSQEETEREAAAAAAKFEEDLTQYYALPPEMVKEFETNPEAILPRLAAKVHMAVVNEAMARFNAVLPRMMFVYGEQQRIEKEATDRFFGRWPGLKEHSELVQKTGAMFRQMNPNATPEEALDLVGRLTYTALKLPVPDEPAPSGAPAQPGATPAPATPPAPPPAPFRPAATGSTGRGPTPAPQNEFQKLAEEFLREDAEG